MEAFLWRGITLAVFHTGGRKFAEIGRSKSRHKGDVMLVAVLSRKVFGMLSKPDELVGFSHFYLVKKTLCKNNFLLIFYCKEISLMHFMSMLLHQLVIIHNCLLGAL